MKNYEACRQALIARTAQLNKVESELTKALSKIRKLEYKPRKGKT